MEVAQHQTVQLMLHVSGWQSSSGLFFPLKQSLKHFKLYERNSASRSSERKLFGRTNSGEWVTPSTSLLNTVLYHCRCCLRLVPVSSCLHSCRRKIPINPTQFFPSFCLQRIKTTEVYSVSHTRHTLDVGSFGTFLCCPGIQYLCRSGSKISK